MKAKVSIVILVILLVVSNAFWAFQVLDAGVSLTYRDASLDLTNDSLAAAVDLANMNLVGLSAEDALQRIRRGRDSSSVFEKAAGCIYVSQICVQLDSTRTVVEVRQ